MTKKVNKFSLKLRSISNLFKNSSLSVAIALRAICYRLHKLNLAARKVFGGPFVLVMSLVYIHLANKAPYDKFFTPMSIIRSFANFIDSGDLLTFAFVLTGFITISGIIRYLLELYNFADHLYCFFDDRVDELRESVNKSESSLSLDRKILEAGSYENLLEEHKRTSNYKERR